MFKIMASATALTLLAACAASSDDGYNVGLGSPSNAWPVTFTDGTTGTAFWCVYSQTCFERARKTCGPSMTLRDPSEIDRAATSPEIEHFFKRVGGQQTTIVVSC